MNHKLLVVLSLLVFGLPSPSAIASQLDEKMKELAESVLAFTKGKSVRVGVFSPTGLPDTSFGAGCTEALKHAINQRKPDAVSETANFVVNGNYLFVKSRTHTDLSRVVKIDARIIDLTFGEEVTKIPFRVELDHTNAIAEVIQETVALPPSGSKALRNQILVQSVLQPKAHIHGRNNTLVSSNTESGLAVEILTHRSLNEPAMPRRASLIGGRPFVDIAHDELYEVKLYNNTTREIAAQLSIDGIDMYHFSKDRAPDGSPAYSHVIVPPRSTATVIGWHNSVSGNDNYKSFLVTSYGKGAASQSGITASEKLGVIHVQFAFSQIPPSGEKSSSGKETGLGPPQRVTQEPVTRQIDPPHDFVSIRYAR